MLSSKSSILASISPSRFRPFCPSLFCPAPLPLPPPPREAAAAESPVSNPGLSADDARGFAFASTPGASALDIVALQYWEGTPPECSGLFSCSEPVSSPEPSKSRRPSPCTTPPPPLELPEKTSPLLPRPLPREEVNAAATETAGVTDDIWSERGLVWISSPSKSCIAAAWCGSIGCATDSRCLTG